MSAKKKKLVKPTRKTTQEAQSVQQKTEQVQWFNRETERWVKFERSSGIEITQKVTSGEYKNIDIVRRKPHIRAAKKSVAPTKPTKTSKSPKVKVKVSAPAKDVEIVVDTTKTGKERKPRKVNYLNNKDLMIQVMLSKEQGQMTNRLAHMLQTLAARYGRKGNFANYCVDADTEALTQQGWKRYNELTLKDNILSYDVDSGALVWSDIKDIYINQKYNGFMHKLDTQGLDALVTPNHKFVSKERGIIPVESIICNEHIVLTGQAVAGPSLPKYSDAFVELVGWAITEGHYIKGSKAKRCISISQKEGLYADKIRQCLQSGRIEYREYCWRGDLIIFNCIGEAIRRVYDTVAPNRILSENFILSLTQTQRLLLIETMVNADGWYRPNGGMSYVQKDSDHVDAFLMLCTMAGLTTSTTPMIYKTPKSGKNPDGGESAVLSTNIYVNPKLYCKAERIDFHGGRAGVGGRRDQKANIPTVHYEGTIWCPQTEYGTFVCRRGKYIYVTGNTYNEDMQAYAMMMLVRTWNSFNPEKSQNPFAFFTQCIKNSFIQFLNQERRQRDVRDAMLVDQGLDPSYTYQEQYATQQMNDREAGQLNTDDVVLEESTPE